MRRSKIRGVQRLRTPMLLGFLAELALFAAAAVLSRDRPAVVGCFVGGFACTVLLARWTARDASDLAGAAGAVAAGDLEKPLPASGPDELGRVAGALACVQGHERELTGMVDAIARGDFGTELVLRSDRDELGRSLQRMQATLRERIGDLEHQALYDALTGLPNRALLCDRLRLAIHAGRRRGQPCALLLMDLDRFKDVNDTFGHGHGDALLKEAALRLGGVLRSQDTLCRLGGDEFAVLVPDADGAAAVAVADRLQGSLREPFVLDGHPIEAAASIGIVVCPQHADDVDTILRHADVAMYQAKHAHVGSALYDPRADHHSPARLAMVGDLRRAIERGQLILYFQPQLDIGSRRVFSAEALVRWNHPTRGLLGPDEFVGLAEQTGLIGDLTAYVLEAAIPQAAAWQEAGMPIAVSVNLSARNLRDARLPSFVAGLLGQHGLRPRRLLLEITESALMFDPDQALSTVHALRSLGLGVAVDDYGTGYSSLAYLRQLPLHELKIDRSFVRDVTVEPGDLSIVRSTITLAHELGLRVVAEGVEDAATLELLADLGCDMAQGYHLSRPVPADEFIAWVAASPWSPLRPRAATPS
jgi:diguanylate cyclase (GGDEF)-like protein